MQISFESYFKQIGIPFIDILNNLNIKNNQNKIENSYRKYSIEFFSKFKFFKNWEQRKINEFMNQEDENQF